MAEVIDLRQRDSKERRVRQARARRRAQAVASALSCGLCPRRCAHCGMAIDEPPLPGRDLGPYPFCAPCLEEYRAFQRWEEGIQEPEAYWHTDQWAEMWRSWLRHMEASDQFRRSAEFLRLMQENQE
jgi:hypothetical protein